MPEAVGKATSVVVAGVDVDAAMPTFPAFSEVFWFILPSSFRDGGGIMAACNDIVTWVSGLDWPEISHRAHREFPKPPAGPQWRCTGAPLHRDGATTANECASQLARRRRDSVAAGI